MKIPFFDLPDTPITSTTQDHIPLADITENLVLFKDGGAALVMESTSLNFGLLSEKEQSAVIAAYAALLNSLTFPIQIQVRSQRKDITKYLEILDEKRRGITNEKLVGVMTGYQQFIFDSIKRKNVLSKKFYVVLPFTKYELGISKSFKIDFASKKETTVPYSESYCVRKAKITLYPKRDHVVRQAGRLGIRLKQLTNSELINLMFNIYNPTPPVKEEGMFGVEEG